MVKLTKRQRDTLTQLRDAGHTWAEVIDALDVEIKPMALRNAYHSEIKGKWSPSRCPKRHRLEVRRLQRMEVRECRKCGYRAQVGL